LFNDWNAENAVIRPRNMWNILSAGTSHMTTGAIRILRVMFYREASVTVAGETLAAKEGRTLLRVGSEVRIVAAGARHRVSAHPLASALGELLNLADTA
jgi:hypothetical protein